MKVAIVLLFFFSFSVLHGSSSSRWISASKGLRMRDKPSLKGKKIGVIPFNTKVTFLEEKGANIVLVGRKGRWTKVKWDKKRGWVFGGFLSREKNNETSKGLLKSFPGKWINIIKKDGEYVIYKHCSAATQSLEFDFRNPSTPKLLHDMGQETAVMKISGIKKNGRKYIFTVKDKSAKKPHEVTFYYSDKSRGIGIWINLVNYNRKDFYTDRKYEKKFKVEYENDGDCGYEDESW